MQAPKSAPAYGRPRPAVAVYFLNAVLLTGALAFLAAAAVCVAMGWPPHPGMLAGLGAAAAAVAIVIAQSYAALQRLVLRPLAPLMRAGGAATVHGGPPAVPEDLIPDTDIGDVLRVWNAGRAHEDDSRVRLSLEALMDVTSRALRPGAQAESATFVQELLKASMVVVNADAVLLRSPDGTSRLGRLGVMRVLRDGIDPGDPLVGMLDAPDADDRRSGRVHGDARADGPAGLVHLPLRRGTEVLGAVTMVRRDAFRTEEQELLTAITGYLTLTLDNLMLSHQVYEHATRDSLTGVWTRRYALAQLDEAIARAAAARGTVSVIMVDVDGLKAANDTWGHQLGDLVLQRVAGAIARTVRSDTVVGRYGGDEFLMVLPDVGADLAAGIAARVRAAVQAGLEAPDAGFPAEMAVSLSVGVAGWPEDSDTSAGLIATADAAMYRAKQSSRNLVRAI